MSKIIILPSSTTTVTGSSFEGLNDGLAIIPNNTFQATITGTGAVGATVLIQVSNDGVGWITKGTITLSATTTDTDHYALTEPWVYRRADLTAISGTSAAVVVTMGV